MAAGHKHPNYMAIFWYLAILTVIEIAVIFLPFGKVVNGTLLCGLAVGKAALVAMYFMHLKWDWGRLYFLIIPALVLAPMLVFALLPDIVIYWRNLLGTETPLPR